MNYLLDTNVFLSAAAAPERLSADAQGILASQRGGLFLSAASAWEIAIKFALGKLELKMPPSRYLPGRMVEWNIQSLPIEHVHALVAGALPSHHRDPFDRMLVAQAQTEGMTFLTSDTQLRKYKVKLLWCGR